MRPKMSRSVSVIQVPRRLTPATWPALSRVRVPPCAATQAAGSSAAGAPAASPRGARISRKMARFIRLAPPPVGQARVAVPDDATLRQRRLEILEAGFRHQRVIQVQQLQ